MRPRGESAVADMQISLALLRCKAYSLDAQCVFSPGAQERMLQGSHS